MQRLSVLAAAAALILSALACNLFGGAQATEEPTEEPTAEVTPEPSATPTTFIVAPTLDPDATSQPLMTETPFPEEEGDDNGGEGDGSAAPTPLPDPTQIDPTGDEDGGTDEGDGGPVVPSTDPGVLLNPDVGEPGDPITVRGVNLEPGTRITLHWGAVDGSTGGEFDAVTVDEDGEFELFTDVPPASAWPGGSPQELDRIQLRAIYDDNGNYYFANYTFVNRVDPGEPILDFNNPVQPYAITVPNGWSWAWPDEDEEAIDVSFSGPGGGDGFIETFNTTNTSSIVAQVMADRAPGLSYDVSDIDDPNYNGVEATASNGRYFRFVVANGQTFAMSFVNDEGFNAFEILNTFRLTGQ
ncbi:MAG: hypothetical protein GYB64_10660 [Chloroflexi bacterium]|nr:hypothetical protein [Chloroflexota bacterium]